MKLRHLLLSAAVSCALLSCSRPVPELKSINLEEWKEDKNGCSGYRTSIMEEIEKQKESMLGLEEMQIVELLGRPDQNELYKRNQKFYYYWLSPSKDCKEYHVADTTKRLAIRFNAMGLAKEITIE